MRIATTPELAAAFDREKIPSAHYIDGEIFVNDEDFAHFRADLRRAFPKASEAWVDAEAALVCYTHNDCKDYHVLQPEPEPPAKPKTDRILIYLRMITGILLIIAFLLLIGVSKAHAQYDPTASRINTVKFQEGGVDKGTLAGPFVINFSGCTVSKSGNTITVSACAPAAGGGDFSSNTATSVDSEIVLFSGTAGKTGKRATTSGVLKGTSGVISAAAFGDIVTLWAAGACTGLLKSDGTCDNSTYVPAARTLTAGAGLSGGGDLSANRTFATDSTEADFLASGALVCGAATQGKIKVHTTPLQYCDNAATPALQYAAYANSSGVATSATILATARSIYGNNFDGSAALAQIIASGFGGTGNGFTKFSGPAGAEKTFTLPNASATVLTDNAVVTIGQGGTGTGSTLTGLMRGNASAMTAAELSGDATTSGTNAVTVAKVNGVAYPSGPATDTVPVITAANTATYKAIPDCDDSGGNHLNYDTATHAWLCGTTGDGAGSGSPGGSDTYVQFNDSSTFGGDAGLVYDKTNDVLSVGTQPSFYFNVASATQSADRTMTYPDSGFTAGPMRVDSSGNVTYPGETGSGTFARANAATIYPKKSSDVRHIDAANNAGWTGADLGAWVNAALSDVSNAGTVVIGPGSYSFSTTIAVTPGSFTPQEIRCEPGAYLSYTGSGDAITIFGAGESGATIKITDCRLYGTSSATAGIHIRSLNRVIFKGIVLSQFSTGDAVLNEGGNNITCFDCDIESSLVGWHDKTYKPAGTRYDPNNVVFLGGQFQTNLKWGWWSDGTPAIASQSALGSLAIGTVFFSNGTTTTQKTISADNATCALAGACRNAGGTVATFITSAAHGLVVGETVYVSSVTDTTFNGICTVSVLVSATSFSCPNVGTASAHSGTGNTREVNGNAFIQYGTNTAILGGYFENANSIVAAPLCSIVVGDNNNQPKGTDIAKGVMSSEAAVNSICIGNGQSVSIDSVTEGASVTNFVNNIGSAGRGLLMQYPSASGATNMFTGTDNGTDNTYLGMTSTSVNTMTNTIRGMGFNNISGFQNDLVIRTRGSGIYANIWQKDDGTQMGVVGNDGQAQIPGNVARVTGDFTTSGVGTALENITGLTWTLRANTAQNVPFTCDLAYHQNTAAVAVSFGIRAATINPTNIFATGIQYTSATASTEGVLATLATTTATNIVTATPSAITTDWVVHLAGMIENPSNASANVITIMAKTATAGDTVTVKRGSWCQIN